MWCNDGKRRFFLGGPFFPTKYLQSNGNSCFTGYDLMPKITRFTVIYYLNQGQQPYNSSDLSIIYKLDYLSQCSVTSVTPPPHSFGHDWNFAQVKESHLITSHLMVCDY